MLNRQIVALLLVLFPSLARASTAAQTLDRSEIVGVVRDETGGVLADVTVTLRETKTGLSRTTVSDAEGRYSAVLLPVGTYVIEAQLRPHRSR